MKMREKQRKEKKRNTNISIYVWSSSTKDDVGCSEVVTNNYNHSKKKVHCYTYYSILLNTKNK